MRWYDGSVPGRASPRHGGEGRLLRSLRLGLPGVCQVPPGHLRCLRFLLHWRLGGLHPVRLRGCGGGGRLSRLFGRDAVRVVERHPRADRRSRRHQRKNKLQNCYQSSATLAKLALSADRSSRKDVAEPRAGFMCEKAGGRGTSREPPAGPGGLVGLAPAEAPWAPRAPVWLGPWPVDLAARQTRLYLGLNRDFSRL